MKRWIAGLALAAALAGGSVMAQDEGFTPVGDIIGDPNAYYGQTVQLEGFINPFVSSNAFVLTDAAALAANNVLVINNTGQPIPNTFVIGQEVVLTGRVHPSFSDVFNGVVMRYPSYYEERTAMMAPDMMATTDPAMGGATTDPMMATQDPALGGATQDPALGGATQDPALGGATQDPNMMATTDPMMATQDPALAGATEEAVPQDNVTDPMAVTQVQPPSESGSTSGSFTGLASWDEDLLAWVYNEALPDEYDSYIIIELTDIALLTYPADS
jgi:hypothetical protein